MFAPSLHRPTIEPLEARIAPAGIADAQFLPASVGGYTIVNAGQGLGTAGENSGTYLLYVEKGTAVVFTTDLNNNGSVDPNEITGIAASNGLRLISFVDIHGDIVTNLDSDTTLSDSNNNSTGDDPILRGDGRVLNNSTIERIEMRSLTVADLKDQNGDGGVDERDVSLRLALTSYSIFGQILAGKGFGVANDATSGLIIDTAGEVLQQATFGTGAGIDYYAGSIPQIGSIRTGSAASFEYFSFGMSNRDDIQGVLAQFTAPAGQVGGDIVGVRAANLTTTYNIDALITGVGGVGARGGNIQTVTLNGDSASGYRIIAGDGGSGPSGGAGGSIINLADLGSETARVEIRAGDGGTASTGAGGSAGNVTLGTYNVNGGISIILGDGGDGFTAGGNGASLTRAVITTPEGGTDVARTVVSSTRDVGHDPFTGKLLNFSPETGQYTSTEIGRKNVIDFDHDGFGDVVFASSQPDQLVVMFGDGFGGFRTDRIYLDGPTAPDAVTVADFNGDGFMDIAAASNDPTNNGGIVVFLARTEDRNGDGQLGQAEDVDRDGVTDFVGFRSALYSPLLSMNSGDPDGGFNVAFAYGGYRSAVAINDIEAGDFDGDGFMDLAVAASVIVPTSNGPAPQQHIIFLKADMENGRPTGQFYADVGTKATGEPPAGANPIVPFAFFRLGNKMVIEATAMTSNATHDVIVAGQVGAGIGSRSIFVLDNSSPGIFGPTLVATGLGVVDTNRNLGPNAFNGAPAEVEELTVLDQNNDGLVDFAVTITQAGLVVSKLGDGLTFPFFITNTGIDNAGLFFGNPNGFGQSTSLVGLRSTDGDGDGRFDQLAVFEGQAAVYIVELDDFPPSGVVANPGGILFTISPVIDTTPAGPADPAGDAFDTWITVAAAPSVVDYITAQADEDISTSRFSIIDVAEHFITVSAGDGGNALIGRGGIGGSIGGTLTRSLGIDPTTGLPGSVVVGALSITLPSNPDNSGTLTLAAGNGGNGLNSGGAGGSVTGTTVRFAVGTGIFHTASFLIAGNGGFGVSSAGGNGGSLVNNSIEIGTSFTAGNGGRGQTGGNGGSIIGNGLSNGNTRIYDSRDLQMILQAGDGGEGVRRGGNGGNITNFAGFFDLNTTAAALGVLSHTAGNGGNAVSGPGGKGGSVTNSSPVNGANNLAGDIVLQGGRGGNGTTGGDGGAVATFINRPGQTINPAVLSIIGGDGGSGVSGVGGRGGSVTGIDTPSIGKPNLIAGQATPYTYNRILGGNGGESSGNTGGVGGGISNVKASNSDNPFVLTAGAGGIGLIRGGAGGSVRDAEVEVGGESLAKLLVIAGAGGGATAFTSNSLDTTVVNQADKAFGGRVGIGGDGGSVVNFVQGVRNASGQIGGNLSGRVDLIAGNGGDTLNFGTVANDKVTVGKGGSVSNVFIAGSIGNIAQNVPIKSYNRELAGETVAEFVNANLRDPLLPGSFDDSIGLVGMVVGASGRLKEVPLRFGGTDEVVFISQPSSGGINGSASSITARNIMSMVAGSVERIASIQSIAFLNVVGTGDVGSVKDPLNVLFRDRDGNPISEPVLDGRLDDGALIYKRLSGGRLPNGNVFQLA